MEVDLGDFAVFLADVLLVLAVDLAVDFGAATAVVLMVVSRELDCAGSNLSGRGV